jgi:hypothetical protein
MPGCPRRLSFLTPSDGHISVPNGDALEPIALACLDEYGNRCAPTPQFGSKWYLRLDDNGPLCARTNKFAVQTDGVVTLDGLYAELDDDVVVVYPGVRLVQSLHLEWPAHLGLSQDTTVKEELCVTVTPGTKPSSIEVCCLSLHSTRVRSRDRKRDRWSRLTPRLLLITAPQVLYNEDILSICRLPVGTVMTGLKLQIMTESNTPWEPSSTSSLVVKADWKKTPAQNKKKPKGKRGSSLSPQENPENALNLPDIKVSKSPPCSFFSSLPILPCRCSCQL